MHGVRTGSALIAGWLGVLVLSPVLAGCSSPGIPTADGGAELDAVWSCAGCFEGTICRAGDTPAQCGQGAVACFACQGDEVCVDGECHAPPPCGPQNCTGCCSPTGTCLDGKLVDSCGKGGRECEACAVGDCIDSVCTELCGPSNCAGCCLADGQCRVLVAQDGRCGTGGVACSPCANDEVCSPVIVVRGSGAPEPGNGTCEPSSCAACAPGCCNEIVGGGYNCQAGTGPFCGRNGQQCQLCQSDESCSNQRCVPNANVQFKVVLESGILPTTNANGNKWDYLSAPDAGVTMRIKGTPDIVGTLIHGTDNSTTPSFALQTAMIATVAELRKGISFDVVDRDVPPVDPHDFIATVPQAPFVPPDELFVSGAGSIELSAGGVKLRLRFVRN
jgi:hypothetical protein